MQPFATDLHDFREPIGSLSAHLLRSCLDFRDFDAPRPSSRAGFDENERPFGIHRAGDELQMAMVTCQAEVTDPGHAVSGMMRRPGFERLVAMVCSGDVSAVYCIEASWLARNGCDWHHLIDLCALAGALVIDPDGAYMPICFGR